MRSLVRLWLSFVLLSSANATEPGVGSTGESRKLTLAESIELAQKGATSVLRSELDRNLSGTALTQSYLQFLPTLTAQGTYNQLRGKTFLTTAVPSRVDASNFGPSYQLATSLNIFNGLSDLNAWRAARQRAGASEETAFRVKQQIALDVAQSFLQVVLDQRLINIAERNLKASRERQTLLEEQSKVGVRSLSDMFRQQAQTSTDESFLITQQNKRQTEMILLLRKLRMDPSCKCELIDPELEEPHDATPPAPDEAPLIKTAMEERRDLNVSKRNADAARFDVYSARANYFPKLDFVATYGASGRRFNYQLVNDVNQRPLDVPDFDEQLRNQVSYTYGVVLTWNLFDRWQTSLNVEKAKVAASRSTIEADDFQRQVTGEVKQAVNDLTSARKQLEAAGKGLTSAKKAFEVSQGKYEVGALSFVDLATAQSQLVQVEANMAQALVGFELQKRALEFAIGRTPVAH